MPDEVRDNSQTGKFSRAELEQQLKAQSERRDKKVKFDMITDVQAGSSTGVIRIIRELPDDSADRDADKPVDM